MKDIMNLTVEELTALANENRNGPNPPRPPKAGYKWVRSCMNNVWVEIEINTPFCCDPSNETYWSM